MVLKYMNFTCPINRKSIHVWEKQEKVSEYGLNEINKRVLLSVPKLITVGEGTPTPMMSLGYSHDVISGGNSQNNKIKY